MKRCCRNIAIIFAGGTGVRMRNDDVPKQFMLSNGKPIIIHTLELFEHHHDVSDIVVVCIESWIERLKMMLDDYGIKKVRSVVAGGDCTQSSIYNGLCEAERLIGEENAVVLVHDGVRPLITEDTISDNIECVYKHGNCITCAMPTETILVNENGVVSVPKRMDMLVGRAPQSFWLKEIIAVHRKAIADGKLGFVDCCEMMHHYGHELATVMGPAENIKITTPTDFYVFEALVKMKEEGV